MTFLAPGSNQWPLLTTPSQSIKQTLQVTDTGLDPTHTEFDDNNMRSVINVWDGNIENPIDISDPTANNDVHGHGSHCAGTVGGSSIGVAPGANIYGVKVLDDEGYGYTSTIVAALNWIGDRAMETNRPTVISMSLGGVSFPRTFLKRLRRGRARHHTMTKEPPNPLV